MVCIGVGVLCCQRTGDGIQIRLRLFARHAWLQARENAEVMTSAISKTRTVGDRNPNFGVRQYPGQISDVRDDSDDGKALLVEPNRLAHDGWVGVEAPSPQSLAHHD